MTIAKPSARMVLTLVGSVALLGGCSGQLPDNAADQAEVAATATAEAEQAFEGFVAAINSGDTATAATIYDRSDGFRWVEGGVVQYASGDEAAASLKQNFPAGSRMLLVVDEMHSAALGPDSALLSAHYTMTALNPNGSEQFSFDGWMTMGMAKRAEGWRIVGGQAGPGSPQAE